ncbi:MAG: alpha/beta hydrolase [Acidobacteriales bacterium]|nr:alpha/beta hydrolase [Terriglobales bacterium]
MSLDYHHRLTIQGSGEPLILVPGMDGTGNLFYQQIPSLAQHYRVITYALRGSAIRLETLGDDLEYVARSTSDKGKPIILGESFGGAVALSLALRHPEMVKGLVMVNSFAYAPSRKSLRLALLGLHAIPQRAMSLVRHMTASRLHSPNRNRETLRMFLAHTADVSKDVYRKRLRMLREYDVRNRINEISIPTLFLAADSDRVVRSLEQARWMASRMPNATVKVLEGHGHVCLTNSEVKLAELLQQWEGVSLR